METTIHYKGARLETISDSDSDEDGNPIRYTVTNTVYDPIVDHEAEKVKKELMYALYDDASVVRTTKKAKYEERVIVSTAMNSLVKCRVQFMMDELTEAKWKSRIYTIEKQRERDLLVAALINIYLATIRDFQSYLYNEPNKLTVIREQLITFIKMTNESFTSLYEEYGGAQLKVREDLSNMNLPALVL
jgi:hypothetical protein